MNNAVKKFLVDAMLGNIAKKLRFFGYDTLYFANIDDKKILEMLQNDNRVLVTKDSKLANKALKNNIQVIFFTINNEIEQLVQIKNQLDIQNFSIDIEKIRCTLCNNHLDKINHTIIQHKIPDKVLKSTNNFWECKHCDKIYWKGTHIVKLGNVVKMINEQS